MPKGQSQKWEESTVTLVGMEAEPLPPPPDSDSPDPLPEPPVAVRPRDSLRIPAKALDPIPLVHEERDVDARVAMAETKSAESVVIDSQYGGDDEPTRANSKSNKRIAVASRSREPSREHTSVGSPKGDERVVAGRYQIEDSIGEGGMGKVLRVKHLRLGKSFALKLMRTAFSGDSRARSLFYREARLASSLSHPNIVSIIDFGEDPRLGAFMVMELLTGDPLSERIKSEKRFSVKMTLELILQMAEALHYIHEKQIIHCDIKPENLLMCRLPGTDRRRTSVKLLDFGLARVDTGGGPKAKYVDGTPEYMAPERICGTPPQPSMDIYGLGVLCYELLTGKLPFSGQVTEVMKAHVQKPFIPLSEHMPDLDERVEAFVNKALEKKPKDRHKDMSAFLYEVRTLMDMLGYGRRRGSRGPSVVQRKKDKRERSGAIAFDLSPLPMAGVNVDGTIIISNRSFNRFLTGGGDNSVEQSDVFNTKLADVHPQLSSDMRKVHSEGRPVQRVLRLKGEDASHVALMLWIVPGVVEAGDVHISVHRLSESQS